MVTTLACHLLPWPPTGLQKGCQACHWKWPLGPVPGPGNKHAFGALASAGSIQIFSPVHPTRSATQCFPRLGPGRSRTR